MYTHLLIDLPAYHEVDDLLPTECDVIRSVVSNLGQEKKIRHVRATRLKSLRAKRPRTQPYRGVRFVHVAGHGDSKGAELIGGTLTWPMLADLLKEYCARLTEGEDRVLCLSCCHSEAAVKKMRTSLQGWFTGYYFFSEERVGFANAIAAWSLFYLQKDAMAPMRKLRTRNSNDEEVPVSTQDLINSAVPGIGFKHLRPRQRA